MPILLLPIILLFLLLLLLLLLLSLLLLLRAAAYVSARAEGAPEPGQESGHTASSRLQIPHSSFACLYHDQFGGTGTSITMLEPFLISPLQGAVRAVVGDCKAGAVSAALTKQAGACHWTAA